MVRSIVLHVLALAAAAALTCEASAKPKPSTPPADPVVVTAADCNSTRLGVTISPADIGEPVSAVTLNEWTWVAAGGGNPAHCRVTGAMAPIDPAVLQQLTPAQAARNAVQRSLLMPRLAWTSPASVESGCRCRHSCAQPEGRSYRCQARLVRPIGPAPQVMDMIGARGPGVAGCASRSATRAW